MPYPTFQFVGNHIFYTTLDGTITGATDPIYVIDNSAAEDAPGLLKIENEIIYYGVKGSNQFSNLIRGYGGTVATGHASGVEVCHPFACDTFQKIWDGIESLKSEDISIAGVKTFGDGIKTDTVGEETSGAGVTVDDVLIKDKSIKVDTINENTSNAGVTIKKLVQTINTATDGETVTFDLSKGGLQEVTLGGNRTLAVSNVSVGQCFVIDLIQDGTGSRTVTWFTTIKWTDGTTPTLTTTANKRDSFGFICKSSGNYQGYIIGQNL